MTDANASSTISEEAAMVAALKRKLVEKDQEHHKVQKRVQGLEDELAIEKREHERTTSKLSLLLSKRGTTNSEESEKELKILHRKIETLQKILQNERNVSQQLRQRLQTQGSYGVASASAVPAVIGARREITPEIKPIVQSSPHAEPHVGVKQGSSSTEVSQVKRNLKVADTTPVVAAASAIAAGRPQTTSSATSVRIPFGYIPGAICVEPPKRQRSNTLPTTDTSSR
eukprot:CAMPEP_0119298568 /NCGR_PEP_ID=MMETSP1333-20130426/730_1 /TAXON_ID=418940 /ORGANISM="Scyphosphaera apsteinii, Strain RCC1455" /LENGTH=227 /DNA_ID=CAMNT_0007299697 /DNA_START=13 /DNA_END=696 /DNA_ORIENTATION=+